MKERYFSPESIAAKAQEFIQKVLPYRNRQSPAFSPSNSALLVLDMQDYFLDETSHAFVPSSRAILPNIKALIEAYSAAGLPVVFTRHANTADEAGVMARWWRDLLTENNPLGAISSELDVSAGVVILKSQYDAFHNTHLEEHLREKGVTQVVVCGVMTHLCCETTARAAFTRGFEVYFAVDGTATYNETFHLASLTNLSHGFAVPVLCGEILAELGGKHEG